MSVKSITKADLRHFEKLIEAIRYYMDEYPELFTEEEEEEWQVANQILQEKLQ